MHRLLTGIGGLIFIMVAGLYWPAAQPSTASEGRQAVFRPTLPATGIPAKLNVHRPLPHPAVIASGQLLISLYALVAQHRPNGTDRSDGPLAPR